VSERGRRFVASGEAGQAIVELALVAPVLLLFVLGMVLFGRVLGARAAISAAAGEAARVDAEASAQDAGLALARQRAEDVIAGYGLSSSRFSVTIDDGGFARGGSVTVQTSYSVPIFDVPLAGRVASGPSVAVHATDREQIQLYRARQP
jgi:Flp pilus assembly protein TadG